MLNTSKVKSGDVFLRYLNNFQIHYHLGCKNDYYSQENFADKYGTAIALWGAQFLSFSCLNQ